MIFRKYLLPLIPIASFVLCWQVLAGTGLINTSLFPAPSKIVGDLVVLLHQEIVGRSVLLSHIVVTLKRLFLASLWGIAIGMLVGVLMGLSQRTYRFCDPIITLVMPIPGIAMAPLFIVWMGFGDATIITVGSIAFFFPVAYNISTGIRSIDINLVRAANIMGARSIGIVFHVYIPWAAVYIFTGIKLGLARCWRTIIAVEFIAAANWGLGYMIWDAAEYLRASIVYGGIILLALTFTFIEKGLIVSFESMTIEKWGMVRS
jgi:ABC-type nitrate/sulfonate/bicarbonate transport system permease component